MTPEEHTETEKLLNELYKKERQRFFPYYIAYLIGFLAVLSFIFYLIAIEEDLNQTLSKFIVFVITIIFWNILKKLEHYKDKLECTDIIFNGKFKVLKENKHKLNRKDFTKIYLEKSSL